MESKGPELRPPVNFIGQDQQAFSDPSMLLNVSIENRPSFAHAKVFLAEGQEVLADWGSLLWMDGAMRMETWCHGGLWKAWWRVCAQEHCCQNKYTAAPGGSEIAFGDDLPGDILPFAVTPGNGWILSHGAFLCGTTNIRVDARFAGCLTCCFGGEGPFFSRITVDDKAGLFFWRWLRTDFETRSPRGQSIFSTCWHVLCSQRENGHWHWLAGRLLVVLLVWRRLGHEIHWTLRCLHSEPRP